MKRVFLVLVLATLSTSALAWGHRGGPRVSFGVHFGVRLGYYSPWYPAYYYPGPYYYPEGAGTWYFCRESNAYYPYVKQCPSGWTRVPAQPSN